MRRVKKIAAKCFPTDKRHTRIAPQLFEWGNARMKKILKRIYILFTVAGFFVVTADAQKTTFTGTAVIYGSGFNTRTVTRSFTFNLTGVTSDADAKKLLSDLQEGGQDELLKSLNREDVGDFAFTGQLSRTVNVARVDSVGDKMRIRAVFERWIGFGELRGGRRSVDYPFSYIEILIDRRTGRGDGTFFSAAKIRFKNNQVEIEDFGTFPSKLMGVRMRGRTLS